MDIILVVCGLFFLVRSIILARQNLQLKALLIEKQLPLSPIENDIIKEDFLKFVSDSREWAFEYIEEVQLALNTFKEKVEPEIKYFDQFGEILSTQRADYQMLKTISDAYKELITVLPENK